MAIYTEKATLEVSGAVRPPIEVVRRQRVNYILYCTGTGRKVVMPGTLFPRFSRFRKFVGVPPPKKKSIGLFEVPEHQNCSTPGTCLLAILRDAQGVFLGGGRNAAASSTVFLSEKEKTLKIRQNIVPGEAVDFRQGPV